MEIKHTQQGFVPHRRGAGFTLIEMIVSVAIIAVVGVALSQVFIATLRTNTKTELFKDVKQNAELALETMVRMIQNAKEVTSSCSIAGTNSTSITIVSEDDGETTFGCFLDGTNTRIASQSAQGTSYLTSSNVSLGGDSCAGSTLAFTCFGAAGIPTSITISFDLAQVGTPQQAFEQASESFQTSATMRNVVE